MIEKTSLGKTSYGGEVQIFRSDNFFDLPAVRCVISQGTYKDQPTTVDQSIEIFNDNPEAAKKHANYIYNVLRHGSIGETSNVGVYLKDVSRLLTFLSWMPVGAPRGLQAVGTERSLRRASPSEAIDMGNSKLRETNKTGIEFYENELEKYSGDERKYMMQFIRYSLPMSTRTEEMIEISGGRELGKFAKYLSSIPFTETQEIGDLLGKWSLEETGFRNYESVSKDNHMALTNKEKTPSRKLLEKNIEGVHFVPSYETLVLKMQPSITSAHQQVRDRQELIRWDSLENVVNEPNVVFPEELNFSEKNKLGLSYNSMHERGIELWNDENHEASAFAQPMGKSIDIISSVHGKDNIKKLMALRTCNKAQTEIRNRFTKARNDIQNVFEANYGERLGPTCETDSVCFEWGKEKCPNYQTLVLNKSKE